MMQLRFNLKWKHDGHNSHKCFLTNENVLNVSSYAYQAPLLLKSIVHNVRLRKARMAAVPCRLQSKAYMYLHTII